MLQLFCNGCQCATDTMCNRAFSFYCPVILLFSPSLPLSFFFSTFFINPSIHHHSTCLQHEVNCHLSVFNLFTNKRWETRIPAHKTHAEETVASRMVRCSKMDVTCRWTQSQIRQRPSRSRQGNVNQTIAMLCI